MVVILRIATAALCFAGAALLVMGHTLRERHPGAVFDAPSIAAADNLALVTVWAAPVPRIELQTLRPEEQRLLRLRPPDEPGVRPAWGAFAVTLLLFLFLWTNIEHAGRGMSVFLLPW